MVGVIVCSAMSLSLSSVSELSAIGGRVRQHWRCVHISAGVAWVCFGSWIHLSKRMWASLRIGFWSCGCVS